MMIQNGALEVQRRWGNPMAAIRWGDIGPELVRLLHDSGVAADEPLSDGTTSLHFFVGERASSIVDALLEAGANPERADSHGKTPLQRAVALGYDDLVEVLLRRGAKITDRRVLLEAAEEGRARAVATNQPAMVASYAHIKEILQRL
jgi:ankyrin repeat protein